MSFELGLGTGGTEEPAGEENLDGAREYLSSMYNTLEGAHASDFDVVAQVVIKGVKYPVTWTADNSSVTIRNSVKPNYYTVDLPDDNDAEINFTLTATISSNFSSNTTTKSFAIKVPAASKGNVLSIIAAIELGAAQGNSAYTTDKYYVSGTVKSITNDTYGNLYITDADGNELLVYGTYDATGKTRFDKMTTKPQVGDTVTFYSVVGNYNGTPQLKNAWLVVLNGEELGGGSGDQGGSSTATAVIDMMGSTNIQSHSAEQLIYSANGIVITNDKASSKTDCYNNTGSYAARFYAGSTLKIEYTGMTKIVLTFDDYSPDGSKNYLEGFDGMTVEGATLVRNNDVLTIYFTAPTNEFMSGNLASQVRIEQIEVFTGDVETPPSGGDNGGNGGSGDSGNTGSYTAPVVGQAYKFFIEQTGLNKTLYFSGTLDAEKGTYLATTENKAAAVDIYFEATNGGYHIYFMNGNTKTYINAAAYLKSNGYAGCHFELGTSPICVWTYDTNYGVLEVYGEIEGKSDTFFAGTYGTYSTISLSGAYYKDQIPSGTQFPARIVLSEGGNTQPENPGTQPENPGTGNEGTDTPENPGTGNEGTDTPENPGTGNEGNADLDVDANYLLGSVNSKGDLYFKGTLTSGRIDGTANASEAAIVKIEYAGAAGEYYIYFMNGGTKTYIGANSAATSSKTSQFLFGTEKGADFVWILDAEAKTIISKAFTGRGIATQVASTYDNFSTYATSNFGTPEYQAAWITVASEGGNTETPENPGTQPENPGTQPENPGTEPENPGTQPENPGTEPENPGTGDTEASLPANIAFVGLENKKSADTYLKNNHPTWTITGKLGNGYADYLGFGRSGDETSAITSPDFSTNSAFTVKAIIKGNGSNGVVTSTLTFTLTDENGNLVATGYANGSDTAAIIPVDATDTEYVIEFSFVEGKTWSDVSNLVVSFSKDVGNIGLKSLDFVQ